MKRNVLFFIVWALLAAGISSNILWPGQFGVPWLPFWVVLGLVVVLWALALRDIPRVWRDAYKRQLTPVPVARCVHREA
jgi:predicted membrane channel-forming protein YqfA (hemolysin III family)